jgi:L-2-hydroxyglutarate oxidase LhgO
LQSRKKVDKLLYKKELSYDVAIVGAGIMGLAIARSLKNLNKSISIVIIEKENQIGLHASGRNSGVLHAGFYYSPDSLKARFCRDGNVEMKKLAVKHNIKIEHVGKIVVAQNDEELSRLELLYDRGITNGVELEIHDEVKLSKFEPFAITHRKFLWSPTTSIVDKRGILDALYNELKEQNVDFIFDQQFLTSNNRKISTMDHKVAYKHLINTAGSGAISIAQEMGFGLNFKMIPFLGVYRGTEHINLPLRTLVYPVPHPINPFLGTHFTITTDGQVKIGPTAQPVLFSEQYSVKAGWNRDEFVKVPIAIKCYLSNNFGNITSLVISEFPQLFERGLLKKSAQLVPSAREIKTWERKPSGIRAQLLRNDTNNLEQDFVVEGDAESTHLLNIVSPGWTSSLSFADWVAKKHVIQHL